LDNTVFCFYADEFQANTSGVEDACAKLAKDCRRNRLSLALLCLQRALMMDSSGGGEEAVKKLVEVRPAFYASGRSADAHACHCEIFIEYLRSVWLGVDVQQL
jgi:hypothetical protein